MIGAYLFYPCLMKLAGVSKEILRVEYFSSGCVLFHILYDLIIKNILPLHSPGVVNVSFLLLSLVFLILQ